MAEEKKEIKLTEKAQKIMDLVKELSVVELADLVKALEEEFGVSAAAPMMAMAAAPAAGVAAVEEKSEFDVELVSIGDNKIAVIKAVKEVTGLGLKEAKDLVDGAPKVVKEKVKKEEAENMKKTIEAAGAKVNLK